MSQSQSQASNAAIANPKPDPTEDPRAALPNLEEYLAIKAACLVDCKHASSPTELHLKEAGKYLLEWTGVRVIDEWKVGEPSSRPGAVLEVAVRYASHHLQQTMPSTSESRRSSVQCPLPHNPVNNSRGLIYSYTADT